MPDRQDRALGNIRPSVTPYGHDFGCRRHCARISVQEESREPHADPVDWRQVPPDELEYAIDRAGDAVSSNFVKLRGRNRLGTPMKRSQPGDFRRKVARSTRPGSV